MKKNDIRLMPAFTRTTSTGRNTGAILLFCIAMVIAAPAQTFNTIFYFDGTNGIGGAFGLLVQGRDGNFYGTTFSGGANNGCANSGGVNSCGTVYKITASGTLTTLYNFCSLTDCADGYAPSPLVLATDGSFYGVTTGGGPNANCAFGGGIGCGTFFRITPSGALTTLYSFCSETECADGYGPFAGLVQGTDGNFYGTTFKGGSYDEACYFFSGCGTIFKITPTGKLTTLHTFDGADGGSPFGSMMQASDGNFYGPATFFGPYNNDGTLFEITPRGTFTDLVNFDSTDGASPRSALVQVANGKFYGTTFAGGANTNCNGDGCGTVFMRPPGGTLTTVYSFCAQANCSDGSNPAAGLVQAANGKFYGATEAGGASTWCGGGCGTLFATTAAGELRKLYDFCALTDCSDGGGPTETLLQSTSGIFYGVTNFGGDSSCNNGGGCGTVFSLAVPGLGPFVETNPTSGKAGTKVTILGNNLKGATSVTFNGTPVATFKASRTSITTTVPAGATTGPVKVVTPGKTLKSNVPFHVP
jgi:uncharacterized repeat protein (TIGR03803 family)